MTFVCLAQATRRLGIDAQATRRLGIDAKTLHRWLEETQLPLQSHPHDGRKKGVSEEHLQVLARLHQRSLTPLPLEQPTPEAVAPPELSATLLALPEQISVIQAQITTLQQQMADLTRLMAQHAPELAIAATQTPPSSRAKPAKKPTRSAQSTLPATSTPAKTPKKPVHVIPHVEYSKQGHYVVICPKHGVLPFEPDTPEWFAWVAKQDSFRFVGKGGHFTAHHEWRVKKGAWRAHRHIRNHSYTLRLAPSHELTLAVLEQTAQALQASLT